jgi:hypothetical protein
MECQDRSERRIYRSVWFQRFLKSLNRCPAAEASWRLRASLDLPSEGGTARGARAGERNPAAGLNADVKEKRPRELRLTAGPSGRSTRGARHAVRMARVTDQGHASRTCPSGARTLCGAGDDG